MHTLESICISQYTQCLGRNFTKSLQNQPGGALTISGYIPMCHRTKMSFYQFLSVKEVYFGNFIHLKGYIFVNSFHLKWYIFTNFFQLKGYFFYFPREWKISEYFENLYVVSEEIASKGMPFSRKMESKGVYFSRKVESKGVFFPR